VGARQADDGCERQRHPHGVVTLACQIPIKSSLEEAALRAGSPTFRIRKMAAARHRAVVCRSMITRCPHEAAGRQDTDGRLARTGRGDDARAVGTELHAIQ
jgi:hypothetical protein